MTADHIDGQIEMARVLIEESREGLAEATACASKEFDPLDWRLLSSCTIGFSAC